MKRLVPIATVHSLALLLVIHTVSGLAAAQSETPQPPSVEAAQVQDASPRPDTEVEAERLFAEGNSAYDRGDFGAARDCYQGAFSLHPSFEVAGNWAQADEKLGRFAEAAEHLRYALRHRPKDLPQEQLAAMQTMLEGLRSRAGTVALSVPTVGALVLVDGVLVGTGPFEEELFREAGTWVSLEAHRKGCVPDIRQKRLQAGEQVPVRLAPTCAVPTIVKPVGFVPHAPAKVLPTAPGPDAELLGAGVGLSATAAVTGLVLTAVSLAHENDADALTHELLPLGRRACVERKADCDEVAASRRARDATANGALVAYSLAGLLAAATVGYALGWEDGADGASVAVRVDTRSVGLAWRAEL